ncbi:hypothetical protein ACLB2K_016080 [Fragaria x ananassa]
MGICCRKITFRPCLLNFAILHLSSLVLQFCRCWQLSDSGYCLPQPNSLFTCQPRSQLLGVQVRFALVYHSSLTVAATEYLVCRDILNVYLSNRNKISLAYAN